MFNMATSVELRGSRLALWRAGGAQEDILQHLRAEGPERPEGSGHLPGHGQDGSEHVPDQPSCLVCCVYRAQENRGAVFGDPCGTSVRLGRKEKKMWIVGCSEPIGEVAN